MRDGRRFSSNEGVGLASWEGMGGVETRSLFSFFVERHTGRFPSLGIVLVLEVVVLVVFSELVVVVVSGRIRIHVQKTDHLVYSPLSPLLFILVKTKTLKHAFLPTIGLDQDHWRSWARQG